jgi:transcriptional regulator with XRE-family HTH domain
MLYLRLPITKLHGVPTTATSEERRPQLTIGEKIRAARLEARLTQEQLAGGDLAKSYISEIERDRRRPRLITLKALARRLNKPLSYFLEGASEDTEIEAYLRLGCARLAAGSVAGGLALLEQAGDLALQQSAELLQARVELAIAMAEVDTEAYARAQRRLDRCLPVLSRHGDVSSLAHGHYCLGRARAAVGDPSSALWAFQAALQLLDRADPEPLLRARLHLGAARAHRAQGDGRAAGEALQRALEAGREGASHAGLAEFHLDRAERLAAEGGFDLAREHAARAAGVCDALRYKRTLAEIHEALGRLAAEAGQWDAAEGHYRWAATLNGSAADLPRAAEAFNHLAEVLLARASPEAARAVCEAALAVLDGEAHQEERGRTLRVLGASYRVAGRAEDAKAALRESLMLLEAGRDKEGARLVHQELAVLALEAGDVSDARHHLGALQKI